jgi:hypothetical protein
MRVVGIALGVWDMDEVGTVGLAGYLVCGLLAEMVPTNSSHAGESLVVK